MSILRPVAVRVGPLVIRSMKSLKTMEVSPIPLLFEFIHLDRSPNVAKNGRKISPIGVCSDHVVIRQKKYEVGNGKKTSSQESDSIKTSQNGYTGSSSPGKLSSKKSSKSSNGDAVLHRQTNVVVQRQKYSLAEEKRKTSDTVTLSPRCSEPSDRSYRLRPLDFLRNALRSTSADETTPLSTERCSSTEEERKRASYEILGKF